MLNKSIWELDFPDEYELEQLTQQAVECAEEELSVQLPKSFLTLLEEKNGGYFFAPLYLPNVFPVNIEEGETGELQVDYLFGISERQCEGILITTSMQQEWNLPDSIVLLTGEGHWWIVLDYRNYKGDNPPVTYIDLELAEERQVAPDFESFLSSMRPTEVEFDENLAIPEIIYTQKQVEKAIKNGSDTLTITEGLRYFSEKSGEINWFIEQLLLLSKFPDPFVLYSCEHYLVKKLEKITKKEIDMKKMDALLEKLSSYPSDKYYDVNQIVYRGARKIKMQIDSML